MWSCDLPRCKRPAGLGYSAGLPTTVWLCDEDWKRLSEKKSKDLKKFLLPIAKKIAKERGEE